jgi:hypothetical protein
LATVDWCRSYLRAVLVFTLNFPHFLQADTHHDEPTRTGICGTQPGCQPRAR